jgi:putative iron-dependent peroxidase
VSFPQTGIFALGDAAHLFLEFSGAHGLDARALVEAAASFHEPRTTVGGINLVVGFRPELWRTVAPDDTPLDARGFEKPIVGPDGFTMPATQADLWLWLAGAAYDIVWDTGRTLIRTLSRIAVLERQLTGWAYRHSRDLTGFEDGTENPSLMEAPDIALVPQHRPGAAASTLLFQKWSHQETWFELSDENQEAAIGRTKRDSVELEGARSLEDSHVSRAKDVVDGVERDIFRRNVPYGDVVDYGTIFVGFSCEQSRLQQMLERMAGVEDGIRDALTRYTTPLTGAYYVIPSITALARFAKKTG